ncbi:EthD domain-containing protein [Sphingomonas colocasiae]|uniref:EthD domain-containing protein n=1 Tax=Sphingomonas colocasiae TaxID=1848973 RepID=A0ABS7PM18_9SPHN|nr:EthD domain-containing protein [Sphingomonas colocasiae]MBY8821745.1 EthD domain-containing protein [Sphingomonas colocasiae]
MIKQIAFLKARPALETSTFIDLYEREHAPLVASLLPSLSGYRRSYVVPGLMVSRAHPGDESWRPDYDVVTQLWFRDAQALEACNTALADKAISGAIRTSEARLFRQGETRIATCEEFITPADTLQPRPAGHHGPPAIKLLGTIRKRSDMSRAAFVERYEHGHCALALRVLAKDGVPMFARYRRSFPTGDQSDFDVLTEVWFWTQDQYHQFLEIHADEKVGAAIAADEAELFDRNSITMVSVQEHISPIGAERP